jgi:hypothetical protein
VTSRLPPADIHIHYPPSACALTHRHVYVPTRLPTPYSSFHFCSEVLMNATAPVSFPHLAARKPMNLTVLLAMIVLGLGACLSRLRPGPGGLHRHHRAAHFSPDPDRRTWPGDQGPGRLRRLRRRPHLAIGSAQFRPGLVLHRAGHLCRRGPGDRRRDHGRGDLKRWHRHPGVRYASRHLYPAASR